MSLAAIDQQFNAADHCKQEQEQEHEHQPQQQATHPCLLHSGH